MKSEPLYLDVICVDSRWVRIKNSPDALLLVAIDECTTRAIAFDLLAVDSNLTWAAFIRSKVLNDPGFQNRKKPSTFYLHTDPESIPLINADIGPPHTFLFDSERCERVCKDFFEGFEKRM